MAWKVFPFEPLSILPFLEPTYWNCMNYLQQADDICSLILFIFYQWMCFSQMSVWLYNLYSSYCISSIRPGPSISPTYGLSFFITPTDPSVLFFLAQACKSISQCYLHVNSYSQIFTIVPGGEISSQEWDDSPCVNTTNSVPLIHMHRSNGPKVSHNINGTLWPLRTDLIIKSSCARVNNLT